VTHLSRRWHALTQARPNLYLRPIAAGTIIWTSPTGRIYRTTPGGAELFPQMRPACIAPKPRKRSRSREKVMRIARARSKIRDQRPVNAETRRINRARNRRSPTASGVTTCAKCWPIEWADEVADENLEIAAKLPVGTIIIRELEKYFLRGALLR
jgi:hypothetical protein